METCKGLYQAGSGFEIRIDHLGEGAFKRPFSVKHDPKVSQNEDANGEISHQLTEIFPYNVKFNGPLGF